MLWPFKIKIATYLSNLPPPEPGNPVRVSFCITHLDRIEQITNSLPRNLQDNRRDADSIEFVLVDFDKDEDLCRWLQKHFKRDLASGYLRYFRANKLSFWHSSIAKNTAHRLGRGEILVNLDGDNYTGRDGGRFIYEVFVKHHYQLALWQYAGDLADGSYGRISLRREVFMRLGGYDESFYPVAYEDGDLLERLKACGIRILHCKNAAYNQTIRNEFRIITKHICPQYKGLSFDEMDAFNKRRSRQNIAEKKFMVNTGNLGIEALPV